MAVIGDVIKYTISAITYVIYVLFGCIVGIIQKVTCPEKSSYDVSCHVRKIVWKRKFFMIDVVSLSDFIGVHERYTTPEYVLNDNVSLYCVTNNKAVFVEVPESLDVYNSHTSAFLYIGQFQHAVRFITMPIASIFKLAEGISCSDIDLCYMPNTGRCGSTLLSQALERVPGTLLLAEPDSLTNVGTMFREKVLTEGQYEELLVATMKVLCKPRAGVNRICIKTRSCASHHITALVKHFPEMNFIFGYRNSLKTVSSFLGLMISETAQSTAMYFINMDWFSKWIPFFRNKMHFYFCYNLEREPVLCDKRAMNTVEQFTYAWCMCITLVKEFIHQDNTILPILYEDMVADKVGTLSEVFKYLSIDEKHVRVALKAFEEDSQEGSVLEQKNIDDKQRRTVSEADRRRANVIMAKFGLPNLGEPFKF